MLLGGAVFGLLDQQAAAQIRTDGTVGPARALAGLNVTIGSDLGKQVGANLFHSFQSFSVPTGGSATFTGPNSVANVIGRVTGGQASQVDGTIASTIPGANLFLLNPAGWMFGPNARLDVQGSFHASTADYLRFSDGARFQATTPSGSSFTTAPPAAFGFLGANPAAISLDRSVLQPPPGRDLSLVGGPIQVTGTASAATGVLVAGGGAFNLAALGGPGEAALGPGALEVSSIPRFADISVTGPAILAAAGTTDPAAKTPGVLAVRGANLTLDGGSILATSQGSLPGVPIDIRLTGDLTLKSMGGISSLQPKSDGIGTPGPITIAARNVRLTDSSILSSNAGTSSGSSITINAAEEVNAVQTPAVFAVLISASSVGSGPAGSVTVNAKRLDLTEDSAVTAFGSATSVGDTSHPGSAGGAITVNVDQLVLRNGAQIAANTLNTAPGGSVTVAASDSVLLTGSSVNFPNLHRSSISAGSDGGQAGTVLVQTPDLRLEGGLLDAATNTGHGGTTTVVADRLTLTDNGLLGALIGSDVLGTLGSAAGTAPPRTGDAGTIAITAHQGIVMADGPLPNAQPIHSTISSDTGGSGRAGSITISTPSLDMRTRTQISTSTFGPGDAGDIQIQADKVALDGDAVVTAQSTPTASGKAGNLTIDAGTITFTRGGFLQNTSFGSGQGGQVAATASKTLDIAGTGPGDPDPSGIFSQSTSAKGGGRVTASAGTIRIRDGGIVSAENHGSGPAGSISLTANQLTLANGGTVSTAAAAGGGGDIAIVSGQLVRLDRSQITTSVHGGTGSGGNIAIDPRFVTLNDGSIQANAFGGNGGNITITAGQLFRTPASIIEASSQLGVNGTINIQAPVNSVTAGLTELSGKLLRPPRVQREGCAGAAEAEKTSSLTLGGRGGLPRDAEGPQTGHYFVGDGAKASAAAGASGSAAAPAAATAPTSVPACHAGAKADSGPRVARRDARSRE